MALDEKHTPADVPSDEQDTELDEDEDDEKSRLLSSREASPTPSEEDSELDPRFNQPVPSRLKRFALFVFLIILFWMGVQMRSSLLESKRKPKIVHASRYSKEHRFRPAASPIITETLKDGRIRLRGALPVPTAPPKPIVKKKPGTGKVSGKKKARKSKRKGSAAEKRM